VPAPSFSKLNGGMRSNAISGGASWLYPGFATNNALSTIALQTGFDQLLKTGNNTAVRGISRARVRK
jgi:hypothetical protein